ncbi:MAG: hypothetical protein AAF184_17120 [Pseudomonadota bacterium]
MFAQTPTTRLRAAVLLVAAVLLPLAAPAQQTEVADALRFETSDQPIFIDQQDNTTITLLDIIDQTAGPTQEGAIINIDQEVPVEVLQEAWQEAIDTCTAQSYTVNTPANCTNATVRPNQSACETGRARGSVTVTCCALGGNDPPGCNGFLDFPVSESVSYDIDIGVGIGPRPTEGVDQPFDVGLLVSYEAEVRAGVELEVATNDGGLLNVDYRTTGRVASDRDAAQAGEVVTLSAWHTPDPASNMDSRYPAMAGQLRYFAKVKTLLDLEWANMDATTGEQVYGSNRLIDIDTGDLNADWIDEDDRLIGEIIGLRVGLADGFELRVLDEVPYAPEGLPGLAWGIDPPPPGANIGVNITNPFTCPDLPVLEDNVCGFPNPPLFTDVIELNFRVPQLNTPVPEDFNGGVVDLLDLTPAPVLINELGADGSLTNTAPSKFREALNFNPDEGIALEDFVGDDTTLDGDYARFELDLDGLITTAFGPAGGASSPFSKELDLPGDLLSLEANSLDSDLVLWLGYDQTLRFEPNLEVDLQFDRPVLVRASADDPWMEVTAWTLDAASNGPGLNGTVQVQQPEGGFTVTPRYTVRNNSFDNQTIPITSFGWQNAYLTLSAAGFLIDSLGVAGIDFDLDFAAFRTSLMAEPFEGDVMGGGPRALAGFEDVPGTPLTVLGEVAQDSDGDGLVDTDDNCTLMANADQRDTDGDGFGNVCDGDFDQDCRVTVPDVRSALAARGTPDPDRDLDGNGVVTFADVLAVVGMLRDAPGPSGVPNGCP